MNSQGNKTKGRATLPAASGQNGNQIAAPRLAKSGVEGSLIMAVNELAEIVSAHDRSSQLFCILPRPFTPSLPATDSTAGGGHPHTGCL
ncbi:hypothetical protein J6590_050116 [Homalodisca vitripennis]|nr:hypothetical protein J6590_050116 [Homalodisca vitripennis]